MILLFKIALSAALMVFLLCVMPNINNATELSCVFTVRDSGGSLVARIEADGEVR